MKVFDTILELIGNTPLVRLNRISKEVKPHIFGKLEFLNPGGSVKDRIGIAMIEEAEEQGQIKPGDTIVEPTSGNTGIGLALAAIVKGYKMIFTIPDKMSQEKIDLLRAFGARVIVAPTAVDPNHPASYVKIAEKIVSENPRAFMPNQYFNPANPNIHYKTTGPEIWEQSEGNIDVFVAGMGTGGTITGTGRYLKEMNPQIRIVGVDPEGSMFHHEFYGTNGPIHTYRVEGIGEDFMPSTLDLSVIDEVITVNDKDAMLTTRRLASEEGLFVGGSSGAAMFGALQVARTMSMDQMLVVLFPDTGRNYLNKIFSDEWLRECGFLESPIEKIRVNDVLKHKQKKIKYVIKVAPKDRVSTAITLMEEYDISQLPVVDNQIQVGSISATTLMQRLEAQEVKSSSLIEDIMDSPLPIAQRKETFSNLPSLLRNQNAVVVVDENNKVVDIIALIDILHYLTLR